MRRTFRWFILAILLIICWPCFLQAQVGINTNSPDSSAALHIQDTTRGLIIPRMTTRQRNSIRNPAEGLMIYQLDGTSGFWYFSGGQWRNIASLNNGGKHTLVLNGSLTNSEAQAKILGE